jgi:hypothetical protein
LSFSPRMCSRSPSVNSARRVMESCSVGTIVVLTHLTCVNTRKYYVTCAYIPKQEPGSMGTGLLID